MADDALHDRLRPLLLGARMLPWLQPSHRPFRPSARRIERNMRSPMLRLSSMSRARCAARTGAPEQACVAQHVSQHVNEASTPPAMPKRCPAARASNALGRCEIVDDSRSALGGHI